MYPEMTIKEFLMQTASNNPIPGGGSCAALAGSVSASLCAMVANLTIGRKGYEAQHDRMVDIKQESMQYIDEFMENIDHDADAYSQVMQAYKQPKDTDMQKKVRKEGIQNALKHAASVPLRVAQSALKLIVLCQFAVESGNKNAATDAAVAGLMARTAGLAALYNVKTNLAMIDDPSFCETIGKSIAQLETDILGIEQNIRSLVEDKIKSQ